GLMIEAGFRQSLAPIEGVAEALDSLTLPICVASSSSLAQIRQKLEITSLLGRSPIWKAGCASSGPSCRAATISPRQWITCSNAGRRSRGSSTTDGSVCRTTPPSERYAELPSAESHGYSPVPTAAASAPQ